MRRGNSIARNLYKKFYGFIPKDEDGKSYDIHHIDGDYNNNDIENLQAVSILEHYHIHLNRGELAAAHRIAGRLSLSKEDMTKLAKERNMKLVSDGKHNWQGGTQQKELNKKRVADGTHNFLNGAAVKKQYADGKPPWGTPQAVSDRTKKQVLEGKHPWTDSEKQKERQFKLISEGKHVSQIMIDCPHCNKNGSLMAMKRWHFDNCKQKTEMGL